MGIGVHGGVVDIFGIPQLHDAAQIHDADPIADVADHIEVVRDKEVRELQVFLKSHEQIENLAGGDIQGGYGLVGHDEAGLGDEGPWQC